jgi:transcription elongation factor GreA
MENKEIVLTKEELTEIEAKLEYLKSVRRREISEQIKQARGFGDITENAEYDEAKNEQGKIEGEIADAENLLRLARIIDNDEIDTATVSVGARVKVLDVGSNEQIDYLITGMVLGSENDTKTKARKITSESPVAKALLGKKAGRTVTVQAPGGALKLKILEITRV